MGKIHRWGVIIAFVVIIVCAWIGIKTIFIEEKDSSVPSVVGMQLLDAVDALQSKGLLAKVDKVDSPLKEDVVVSQNLPAGEKVSKGKVILLKVSKGGSVMPIPDVRGMKYEEAVKTLNESGFKVDKILRVTDKLKASGSVIAQNPAAPQQVAKNTMISLLVSSGNSHDGSFVQVPDLVGQPLEMAAEVLEQIGLIVGAQTELPSAAMPAGTILSTNPRKNAKVPAGTQVSITFARAPKEGESVPDAMPESATDKERAAAVRTVVIKEAVPSQMPSKIPEVKEKTEEKAKTVPVQTEQEKPKTEQPKSEVKPAEDVTPKEEKPVPSVPKKTAKIRYQVPPLSKPLSIKIEMKDSSGTHVLKDGLAKSGEYISMNAPYSGEAVITILLGGDFVWQDRFN